MKIRIKGNTLRLRLTKSEVALLATEGKVEERTPFPGDNELTYSLLTTPSSTNSASFKNNEICIFVQTEWAADWNVNEVVGIDFCVNTGETTLHVLIEKDFNCLTPRTDEDQEDHFTNPLISNQKC